MKKDNSEELYLRPTEKNLTAILNRGQENHDILNVSVNFEP